MCCNDPSKTDSACCFFPAHTISPCVFCTGRLRNDLPDVIQAAASRRGENASHCHANRPTADNFDEINDTHSQLAQRHKAHFYNMLMYGGQTVSRCGVMCPVYLIERNCFKVDALALLGWHEAPVGQTAPAGWISNYFSAINI